MPTLLYDSYVALLYTDSKTLKEEKREELFENLKADGSLGWEVDVIDPRELSAKMLKRSIYDVEILGTFFNSVDFWSKDLLLLDDREKINLNEISHNSAIGLVRRVLNMGVLLTEVKYLYISHSGHGWHVNYASPSILVTLIIL